MKNNKSQPKSKAESNDPEFERTVYQSLLAEGYVVPESAEELRVAEGESPDTEVPLPAALDDPNTVLRRIQERVSGRDAPTIPFPLPQEPGVDEELSRAARHGSKLSPQVKSKMADNRRKEDRKREIDGAAE